jgi:radical SAM protein with 4Fe4S-binding SPASM domain
MSSANDVYGHAREPESTNRLPYGRFRNVYLYINNSCQLRCKHCYMGERLDAAESMPLGLVLTNLSLWRRLGGSKLSILGGEPTLHSDFRAIVDSAHEAGYEKVILNTNGLASARRVLGHSVPADFSYIQVSIDGGSAETHDAVRGNGTFAQAWRTTEDLAARGFDTRVICTVNRANVDDCLELIGRCEAAGVSLVKFHVFSGIGLGADHDHLLLDPLEWVAFCDRLREFTNRSIRIWFQPTYARQSQLEQFSREGYRGCIGRTLDRISVFPDGRAYVCSYLFDTALNFAHLVDGTLTINKSANEVDLFFGNLASAACGSCRAPSGCFGGCPAERVVMGAASCASGDVIPICRLWKSEID